MPCVCMCVCNPQHAEYLCVAGVSLACRWRTISFHCIFVYCPSRSLPELPTDLPIGIDLGTTRSCAAVLRDNRNEIVVDRQGSRATPSCVAFTETGHVVGDAAKQQASTNPHNTVFDVKRLIGRRTNSPAVAADMEQFPFKCRAEAKGRPIIEVQFMEKITHFRPEDISAMVSAR